MVLGFVHELNASSRFTATQVLLPTASMRANDDDPNWWRRERAEAAVVCTLPPVWILALAVLFALGVRAWAAWLSEAYTRLTGTTPTNAIAPSAT